MSAIDSGLKAADSAFTFLGKVMDKIPDFPQRKKTEYQKILNEYVIAKKTFSDYSMRESNLVDSDVFMGLMEHIIMTKKNLNNLVRAFDEELD